MDLISLWRKKGATWDEICTALEQQTDLCNEAEANDEDIKE
jgi:hypothetical protein